jgi:hypothetical protein
VSEYDAKGGGRERVNYPLDKKFIRWLGAKHRLTLTPFVQTAPDSSFCLNYRKDAKYKTCEALECTHIFRENR